MYPSMSNITVLVSGGVFIYVEASTILQSTSSRGIFLLILLNIVRVHT